MHIYMGMMDKGVRLAVQGFGLSVQGLGSEYCTWRILVLQYATILQDLKTLNPKKIAVSNSLSFYFLSDAPLSFPEWVPRVQ